MKNFLKQKQFIIPIVIWIFVFGWMMKLKGGKEILDQKLFYFPSDVHHILHIMHGAGRMEYRLLNELDFIFVFTYTWLFYLVYKKFFKDNANTFFVIPICLAVADIVENCGIFYLLREYPNDHHAIEIMLVIATPVKWFLALSSLLVLANGSLVNWYLKISEK